MMPLSKGQDIYKVFSLQILCSCTCSVLKKNFIARGRDKKRVWDAFQSAYFSIYALRNNSCQGHKKETFSYSDEFIKLSSSAGGIMAFFLEVLLLRLIVPSILRGSQQHWEGRSCLIWYSLREWYRLTRSRRTVHAHVRTYVPSSPGKTPGLCLKQKLKTGKMGGAGHERRGKSGRGN